MKRRSKKRAVRDREMEQVKAMTTLSLTQNEVRDRLLADKAALQARLRELFEHRRWHHQNEASVVCDSGRQLAEAIKGIGRELRRIKLQLQ